MGRTWVALFALAAAVTFPACESEITTDLGDAGSTPDADHRDAAFVTDGGTPPQDTGVVLPPPPDVVVNELMYHPPGDVEASEFIELYNRDVVVADLEGWTLRGVGLSFAAGSSIAPDSYLVVAKDPVAFESEYGFAPAASYPGRLANDGELLTLADAHGRTVDFVEYDDRPPWPVTPDGLGPSLELIHPGSDRTTPRNWHASRDPSGATPGRANSVVADAPPPWFVSVSHPVDPDPNTALPVTAIVEDASDVELTYVINFDPPVTVTMTSMDGRVYEGSLPPQPAQTLLRFRMLARGPSGETSWPRDDDTVHHGGTVVRDPSVVSQMPVVHWFIEPERFRAALDHRFTDALEPAVFYFDGLLFDDVQVRVRGHTSRGYPKNHWKVRLPHNHPFAHPALAGSELDQFDLQSNYTDKSYVREILSHQTLREAGHPYLLAAHVRLHQNGSFFGLYTLREAMDTEFLERNGLDSDGSWYKAFDDGSARPLGVLSDRYEKKTRRWEGHEDLFALLEAINGLTGPARRDYIFDHVDLPNALNFLAVTCLIHNNDHPAKNYFLYRDTNGTERWGFHAWDLDLTFGRNFGAGGGVLSDGIWADDDRPDPGRPEISPSHPLFGDRNHQKWDNLWNKIIDAILDEPEVRAMYHRRLRTLMDEQLVPGVYEARIDALTANIGPEVALDRMRWQQYGISQTLEEATNLIVSEYLPRRRSHLFTTHRLPGEIPDGQSTRPSIVITELMFHPSTDPDDEFVELYNPSPTEAVDLSGWFLQGPEIALPPGTVILPEQYLVVVKNDPQFRATYGSGRFAPAMYRADLADAGEGVVLLDRAANVVDSVTYGVAAPWPTTPAGGGPSLELLDVTADNALPASWSASRAPGGTPGAQNSVSQ